MLKETISFTQNRTIMEQEKERIDVYALVTNHIISQLEQKIVPWQKPWTTAGIPQNLVTRNSYRGINLWLLASLGYANNSFLTWNQIKFLKGSVNKGEQGHIVVFWKTLERKEEEDQKTSTSILRYYKVFNIEQCTGIPEHLIPQVPEQIFSPIAECERIIELMENCPLIKHEEAEAYYSPEKDSINMPNPQSFKTNELYYSVLFHELVHSTGHETRLNRKELTAQTNFGSKEYSIEELTAEIGSCYLNSLSGIGTGHFKQNVAYIKGWLDALKNDKRLIVYASSQAQRATDYILNVPPPEKY